MTWTYSDFQRGARAARHCDRPTMPTFDTYLLENGAMLGSSSGETAAEAFALRGWNGDMPIDALGSPRPGVWLLGIGSSRYVVARRVGQYAASLLPGLVCLSNGESYVGELVVYRDDTSAAPRRANWRLFWARPGTYTGVNAASQVTEPDHHVWFRTMHDAIVYGELHYGVTAKRADF